jgi:hypothetical protein
MLDFLIGVVVRAICASTGLTNIHLNANTSYILSLVDSHFESLVCDPGNSGAVDCFRSNRPSTVLGCGVCDCHCSRLRGACYFDKADCRILPVSCSSNRGTVIGCLSNNTGSGQSVLYEKVASKDLFFDLNFTGCLPSRETAACCVFPLVPGKGNMAVVTYLADELRRCARH